MRFLFIDRKHVQIMDGVRRVFHQPVKEAAPVLAPERPWEDDQTRVDAAPIWGPERGVWRLWYSGGKNLLPLYAESRDGIDWKKPSLGRVEWRGSTDNNIVNAGKTEPGENASPVPHALLLCDDDEPDPSRRFKGFAWFREKGVGSYLRPFVSPDGFDWTPVDGDRVPSEDTKRCFRDTLKNRYGLTVKGLHGHGVTRYGAAELGRTVYLSQSDDFEHWTEPELIFHSDEIDRELGRQRIEEAVRNPDRRGPLTVKPDQFVTDVYCMPVFVYEDLYLALPVLFNQAGRYFTPSGRTNQDGILYPTLAASRDLYAWDRLSREPFIPLSPLSNPDCYDYGMIRNASPAQNADQDELRFYYTGYRFTHLSRDAIETANLSTSANEPRHAIFLARMRRDGFASLDAADAPGIVLTKPIEVTGSKLFVNADAAQGELKVEIRDAVTGRALPNYAMGDYLGPRVLWSKDGKRGALRIGPGARFEDDPKDDVTVPVSEDGTAIPIRWKGRDDLSSLKGRHVRLFFYLRDARLFSFYFES